MFFGPEKSALLFNNHVKQIYHKGGVQVFKRETAYTHVKKCI